ncbi:hypothetical protein GCM10009720_09270 [Yaniella flava]|uniref:Uncharacterized protein n=1 Tax=Yaniella flava TaxID=287930 RepID=A0ABN2U7X7_9MICC
MTTPLTSAQQAQQSNRTNDGKYTTKTHSESDVNLGPNMQQKYADKQRRALAKNLAVERQGLQSKERVLELLEVHDLHDELRAKGVKQVEVAEAFEHDYDAPGSFYVTSEPEFLGGYQPTSSEEDVVIDDVMDADLSFNALAGADISYEYGGNVTIDTTKDPGGISRKDLEDQVEKLLDTGDEYRILGGLDPAKVTSNSNSKLFVIDTINSNRNMDPNHRMELILQQAEDWDHATRNSTSRPHKFGNVPERYNHLGDIKDR